MQTDKVSLFDQRFEIGFVIAHLAQRIALVHRVRAPAMLEQRPGIRRHDRRFMRPLLGGLTTLIQVILERAAVVGAKARPGNQKMCRHQHIDVIKLKQIERIEQPPKMALVRSAAWARPVKALCGERNPARLGSRKPDAPH